MNRISTAMREATASGLLLVSLAACSAAAQAATYTMYRDVGCGCCLKWKDHVEDGMTTDVKVIEAPDMSAIKQREGVPPELWSCHTMVVDGYVIEGHVPADAIARLLKERPAGVTGLAVPGMPVGSPGMEQGDMMQPYDVIAFGPQGQAVFASYP